MSSVPLPSFFESCSRVRLNLNFATESGPRNLAPSSLRKLSFKGLARVAAIRSERNVTRRTGFDQNLVRHFDQSSLYHRLKIVFNPWISEERAD